MASSSFFEPDGDAFVATELTRGPWDSRLMHGGPPAALLGRALARLCGEDMQVARITVELVRPLEIGKVSLACEVVRAGRKVRVVRGTLSSAGRELVRAEALALRIGAIELPEPVGEALPDPESFAPWQLGFFRDPVGYHTAMELRAVAGVWGSGRMSAWMRMRVPLLPGEVPSGLERVLIAADSGNGISAALDPGSYSFLNPDLTVCLQRHPVGEWVCLEAATVAERTGIGLAQSALHDRVGPIGRSLQTLIIEARA